MNNNPPSKQFTPEQRNLLCLAYERHKGKARCTMNVQEEWSPTILRMVTHQPKDVHHQPKDGHPPEGNVLQTSNWALKHYLQNYHQVTTAMHSHLLSLWWSPTNPRMVTHQKEVYYRLKIWQLNLTDRKTSGDSCRGWSPTILRRVTRQPWDGHPPIQEWSPCLAPFDTTWP